MQGHHHNSRFPFLDEVDRVLSSDRRSTPTDTERSPRVVLTPSSVSVSDRRLLPPTGTGSKGRILGGPETGVGCLPRGRGADSQEGNNPSRVSRPVVTVGSSLQRTRHRLTSVPTTRLRLRHLSSPSLNLDYHSLRVFQGVHTLGSRVGSRLVYRSWRVILTQLLTWQTPLFPPSLWH